jgi:integrase
MKSRHKGAKRRNLTKRGGTIYYQRVVGGKRVRFSCETGDWSEAARVRDLYEAKKGIGRVPAPILEKAPRFRDLAAHYLKTAKHLADSTREDRESHLGEDGQLVAYFGERRVDEISRGDLLTWWETEIEGRGRATNTGLNYLNSLAGVFGLAEDLDHVEQSPVASFRRTLKRRRLTKRGRLEAQERDQRHPIESTEALRAFLAASEAASQLRKGNGKPQLQRHAGHVADLLMLDGGLRVGEVAGLRWSYVHLGESPSDPGRRLVIEESRARGRYKGAPKSGRTREVPLSRRLRRVLRAWWIAQGQPASEEHVLPGFHPTNYQRRHFALVLESAKLEGRGYTPKNLRHSFASWLLTAGVPVAYVGELLGHADGGITASKHYAKWVPRGYVAPPALSDGELVVDLPERITESPQFDPTSASRVENDILGSA